MCSTRLSGLFNKLLAHYLVMLIAWNSKFCKEACLLKTCIRLTHSYAIRICLGRIRSRVLFCFLIALCCIPPCKESRARRVIPVPHRRAVVLEKTSLSLHLGKTVGEGLRGQCYCLLLGIYHIANRRSPGEGCSGLHMLFSESEFFLFHRNFSPQFSLIACISQEPQ